MIGRTLPDYIEQYAMPASMKMGFRCKLCGAVCELSDWDLVTLKSVEFNHECKLLGGRKP